VRERVCDREGVREREEEREYRVVLALGDLKLLLIRAFQVFLLVQQPCVFCVWFRNSTEWTTKVSNSRIDGGNVDGGN